jgi:hypothetical protein
VYLGNTRGIFDMGHRNFSRNDPRFWGECRYGARRVAQLMSRLDDPRVGDVRPSRVG